MENVKELTKEEKKSIKAVLKPNKYLLIAGIFGAIGIIIILLMLILIAT